MVVGRRIEERRSMSLEERRRDNGHAWRRNGVKILDKNIQRTVWAANCRALRDGKNAINGIINCVIIVDKVGRRQSSGSYQIVWGSRKLQKDRWVEYIYCCKH